jgi:hypothetical protein
MLGNKGGVTVLEKERREVGGIFSELQITYRINPILIVVFPCMLIITQLLFKQNALVY